MNPDKDPITVTDYFIRREDGTTTMVRTHKGTILEVNEDYPIVWFDENAEWASMSRLEPPRYLKAIAEARQKPSELTAANGVDQQVESHEE